MLNILEIKNNLNSIINRKLNLVTTIKMATVYVITYIFSRYKEELHDSNINTKVFNNYDKAKEIMEKIAKELYENSEIIQEAEDKYFEEYTDCIYFGENSSYGIGYRSEWGLVKLEEVVMEK